MQLDDLAYDLVMSVPKYRKRLLFVAIGGLMSVYMANKKVIDDHISGRAQLERQQKRDSRKSSGKPTRRVGVNALFFSQLKRILPICVPGNLNIYFESDVYFLLGVLSKEFGMLATLAGILVARTYLDIWFTGFNGVVVRSIVSKDWNLFVKNALVLFGFMMWPMVFRWVCMFLANFC